ncbi:hypothetical protein HK097_007372, partial [Rhizophlyctis rosea]
MKARGTSGPLIHVVPQNTASPSGAIKKVKNPSLPESMRPRKDVDLSDYMITTAAPQVSYATKFAADFLRQEKKMQLEDEHQEAILARSEGVAPPSLTVVRKVQVVNMPTGDQIKNGGVNASMLDDRPPANPPPKDTMKAVKTPVILKPTVKGGQDVFSYNPKTDQTTLTNTEIIKKEAEKMTSVSMPGQFPKEDVPAYKGFNPIRQDISTVLTNPGEMAKTIPEHLRPAHAAIKIEKNGNGFDVSK